MTRLRSVALGLLCGLSGIACANAADLVARKGYTLPPEADFQRFYIHAGPAGLFYSESAKMHAAGTLIPGADIRIPNSLTFAVEAGYFINPNFAIGFAGGYPPLVKVEGRGSITGTGTLGKVAGGPTALTAQYHFTGFGNFQPYIGIGPSLMIIFNDKDGAVTDLKTDHALGIAGQIGFNYMLNDNWGVFVDLKKVYLRARTAGMMGPAPIKATVTLDPLVLHSGVTYRF
jgi:outer membrane protein